MPPKRRVSEEPSEPINKKAKLVRKEDNKSNDTTATNKRSSRAASTAKSSTSTRRSTTATKAGRRSTTTRSGREKPIVKAIPKVDETAKNIYVFGSGSICELGLGPTVTEVKRPRLNPLLPIDEAKIAQVNAGGAHVLAIDTDGKVWSWGPNDSGVLGRNTKETEEEKDEDNSLNGRESTPNLVTGLPQHARFVSIGASDNCSAAVTSEGQLWAWGTFIDDGDKAFRPGIKIQHTPMHITSVKGVSQVAAGKEHLLILDKFGDIFSWGIGQSNQLGYPVKSNLRTKTVGPSKIVGLPKIKYVAAGEYHSFAIDENDQLWGWGLNNFGQCCIPEESGEGKVVERPTLAEFFKDKKVLQVDGGNHHSLILTDDGDVYGVGETNFHQIGIPNDQLPKEFTVYEGDKTTPSYVYQPTKLTKACSNVDEETDVEMPKMKHIACGVDHSLALSKEDGSVWTWGFGEVYQLGHGKPAGEDSPEDQPVPSKINNTASRGVNMVWCGGGGQFSVAVGMPKEEDEKKVNGNGK